MAEEGNISSETLEVYLSEKGVLTTLLQLLSKRLDTLDLISVMQEVLPFLYSPSSHSGPRLPSPQLKISRASIPLQVHYLRCVCYIKLGNWVCKHGYWQNL